MELTSSDILLFETERAVDPERQRFAFGLLDKARHFVKVNSEQRSRAKEFNRHGVEDLDALHLAAAEAGGVDYFCTCDDKLLKKARLLCRAELKLVTPTDLLKEIE